MTTAAIASPDRSWFIVSRWQEFQGESRANLLRVIALAAYYGVQLYRYLALEEVTESARAFQRETTLIVGSWSLVAVAVLLCLTRGIFPAALKYLSTAADIALVTLLARAGQGADSPLVHVYFLILAMTALRFSVGLVWFATVLAMVAYLALVGSGDEHWFDAEHATPVIDQLMMLTSLALTGVVLGQVVRRVRALALEFAGRRAHAGATP